MKEEIKSWVDQSEKDLDTGEYLFEGKRYDEAAFFFQQSVEKALKALLLQLAILIHRENIHVRNAMSLQIYVKLNAALRTKVRSVLAHCVRSAAFNRLTTAQLHSSFIQKLKHQAFVRGSCE